MAHFELSRSRQMNNNCDEFVLNITDEPLSIDIVLNASQTHTVDREIFVLKIITALKFHGAKFS